MIERIYFYFGGYVYENSAQRVLLKWPAVVDLIKLGEGANEKRVLYCWQIEEREVGNTRHF